MKTNIGIQFTNAGGELIISYQLLNSDGKAEAVADFRNGLVERFDSTSTALSQAREWLIGLIQQNKLT